MSDRVRRTYTPEWIAEVIGRLLAEVNECADMAIKVAIILTDERDAANARAETAEALAAERLEALRPFPAAWKEQLTDDERLPRAWRVSVRINNDHFRRAAALVQEAEGK